jgi:hypothetical protein
MAQGRHVRRRRFRAATIVAIVAGAMLLIAGGVSYGAYRFEASHADLILPGVTVDGVDVGGMDRAHAIAAVRAAVDVNLQRQLRIQVAGMRWNRTAADLGQRAGIAAAVDRALTAGDDLGTLDRFWHRVRHESIDVDVTLRYRTEGPAVDRLAATIAGKVVIPARDAALGINADHTDVDFVYAQAGRKLLLQDARNAILRALKRDRALVRLDTARVAPSVTRSTLGHNIVVHVDQNRLYLYDGFQVVKSWAVATAKPGYTTPTGVWNIYDMRENPSWYNPALDSWGAGLPAVIPGGPGNPMGTRAIYIDAPGLIRVHGTTDDSSIGRYASHGCIRMHNAEVEDLFERVSVGQHVIVVGYRPANAGYWDVPAASDI